MRRSFRSVPINASGDALRHIGSSNDEGEQQPQRLFPVLRIERSTVGRFTGDLHNGRGSTRQIDRMNQQGEVIQAEADEQDSERDHRGRPTPQQREHTERGGTECPERKLRNDDLRAETVEIDRSQAAHVYQRTPLRFWATSNQAVPGTKCAAPVYIGLLSAEVDRKRIEVKLNNMGGWQTRDSCWQSSVP